MSAFVFSNVFAQDYQFEDSNPHKTLYVQLAPTYTGYLGTSKVDGDRALDRRWSYQAGIAFDVGIKIPLENAGIALIGKAGLMLHRVQRNSNKIIVNQFGYRLTGGIKTSLSNQLMLECNLWTHFIMENDKYLTNRVVEIYDFDKTWFGSSLIISRRISDDLEIGFLVSYGLSISSIPVRGASGSIYGHTQVNPIGFGLSVEYSL